MTIDNEAFVMTLLYINKDTEVLSFNLKSSPSPAMTHNKIDWVWTAPHHLFQVAFVENHLSECNNDIFNFRLTISNTATSYALYNKNINFGG